MLFKINKDILHSNRGSGWFAYRQKDKSLHNKSFNYLYNRVSLLHLLLERLVTQIAIKTWVEYLSMNLLCQCIQIWLIMYENNYTPLCFFNYTSNTFVKYSLTQLHRLITQFKKKIPWCWFCWIQKENITKHTNFNYKTLN